MKCNDLKPGQIARLVRMEGDDHLTARLLDLGIHPGLEVELFKKLPLGGPIVLRANAGFLALRGEEAACLIVTL